MMINPRGVMMLMVCAAATIGVIVRYTTGKNGTVSVAVSSQEEFVEAMRANCAEGAAPEGSCVAALCPLFADDNSTDFSSTRSCPYSDGEFAVEDLLDEATYAALNNGRCFGGMFGAAANNTMSEQDEAFNECFGACTAGCTGGPVAGNCACISECGEGCGMEAEAATDVRAACNLIHNCADGCKLSCALDEDPCKCARECTLEACEVDEFAPVLLVSDKWCDEADITNPEPETDGDGGQLEITRGQIEAAEKAGAAPDCILECAKACPNGDGVCGCTALCDLSSCDDEAKAKIENWLSSENCRGDRQLGAAKTEPSSSKPTLAAVLRSKSNRLGVREPSDGEPRKLGWHVHWPHGHWPHDHSPHRHTSHEHCPHNHDPHCHWPHTHGPEDVLRGLETDSASTNENNDRGLPGYDLNAMVSDGITRRTMAEDNVKGGNALTRGLQIFMSGLAEAQCVATSGPLMKTRCCAKSHYESQLGNSYEMTAWKRIKENGNMDRTIPLGYPLLMDAQTPTFVQRKIKPELPLAQVTWAFDHQTSEHNRREIKYGGKIPSALKPRSVSCIADANMRCVQVEFHTHLQGGFNVKYNFVGTNIADGKNDPKLAKDQYGWFHQVWFPNSFSAMVGNAAIVGCAEKAHYLEAKEPAVIFPKVVAPMEEVWGYKEGPLKAASEGASSLGLSGDTCPNPLDVLPFIVDLLEKKDVDNYQGVSKHVKGEDGGTSQATTDCDGNGKDMLGFTERVLAVMDSKSSGNNMDWMTRVLHSAVFLEKSGSSKQFLEASKDHTHSIKIREAHKELNLNSQRKAVLDAKFERKNLGNAMKAWTSDTLSTTSNWATTGASESTRRLLKSEGDCLHFGEGEHSVVRSQRCVVIGEQETVVAEETIDRHTMKSTWRSLNSALCPANKMPTPENDCLNGDAEDFCGYACGFYQIPLDREVVMFRATGGFNPRWGRSLTLMEGTAVAQFVDEKLVYYYEASQNMAVHEEPQEFGPPKYFGEFFVGQPSPMYYPKELGGFDAYTISAMDGRGGIPDLIFPGDNRYRKEYEKETRLQTGKKVSTIPYAMGVHTGVATFARRTADDGVLRLAMARHYHNLYPTEDRLPDPEESSFRQTCGMPPKGYFWSEGNKEYWSFNQKQAHAVDTWGAEHPVCSIGTNAVEHTCRKPTNQAECKAAMHAAYSVSSTDVVEADAGDFRAIIDNSFRKMRKTYQTDRGNFADPKEKALGTIGSMIGTLGCASQFVRANEPETHGIDILEMVVWGHQLSEYSYDVDLGGMMAFDFWNTAPSKFEPKAN